MKIAKIIIRTIVPARLIENCKKFLIKILGSSVVKNNVFESIKIIKNLGYSPDLVFDIGAYKGEWTKETQKVFPKARFFMVEAQADKEIFLKSIVNKSTKISYYIGLLGALKKEKVPFYKMETGSSIYSENSSVLRNLLNIDMNTLDQISEHLNNHQSAFLKLDVQGAEIDILRGSKKTLEKIDVILLEVSVRNYNVGGPLVSDIFKYMDSISYTLFDVCEQRRDNKNLLLQADLLFISSRFKVNYNF